MRLKRKKQSFGITFVPAFATLGAEQAIRSGKVIAISDGDTTTVLDAGKRRHLVIWQREIVNEACGSWPI